MGRRIEVELTSTREDGSWTWRAAGAKQPKGSLTADLLYDGAKVGDVVKAEAEFHLDGIEVTEVFAPKAKKERSNLLEMKSRPLRDDELVTTKRVSRDERRGGRGRSRGDDRGRRGDRRDRDDRSDRRERRGPRPEAERRPKPKRLRPKRVHRDALLAEVTEEHRPIVEQVMREGMPGVRAAIDKQNTEAKAAGKPEIDPSPIVAIAEKNLGPARLAEWRDRADAALADAAELDIRDLRSVVVAGSDLARDDETRAMVDQIKTVLDERLESDHTAWLQDLDAAVSEGRVVRGLRLSSRPVKAGAPLPTEIATKLADQACQALAADVAQDRWATVLDALAFSPVRGAVTPVGIPSEPGEELLNEVRRLSDRIPSIAALFGVDPAQVPKSAKRRRSPRRDGQKPGGRGDRGGAGGQGGQGQGGQGKGGQGQGGRPSPPHPGAEKPADETPSPEAEPETPSPDSAPPAEADAGSDAVAEASPEPTPEVAENADAPATDAPAESEPAAETPESEAAPENEPEATEPEPAAETPAPEAEATDTPAEAEPAAETPAPEPETADAEATEAPAETEPTDDEAKASADGESDDGEAAVEVEPEPADAS